MYIAIPGRREAGRSSKSARTNLGSEVCTLRISLEGSSSSTKYAFPWPTLDFAAVRHLPLSTTSPRMLSPARRASIAFPFGVSLSVILPTPPSPSRGESLLELYDRLHGRRVHVPQDREIHAREVPEKEDAEHPAQEGLPPVADLVHLRPAGHDLLRGVETAGHLGALLPVPKQDRQESPRARVPAPPHDLVVVRLRELGGPCEDLRVLVELRLPAGGDGPVRRCRVHDRRLPADSHCEGLRGV